MADLVIEQCVPSDRSAEIKGLFERAGQPGFSTVFERVYLVRERQGLRSWIALENGQAVLHISVAPQPFTDGTRTMTGGLMGDLMADEAHRDFWGPIKLARRMASDVKKDKMADFLLTSYVPQAEGVFRAAGFKKFSEMRRHVMPVLWPYRVLRRLLLRQRVPTLTAIPFGEGRMEEFLAGLGSPGYFRPVPSPQYYATRMPRREFPAGSWLLAGDPARPDAAVLVSPISQRELLIASVLWRDPDTSIEAVFAATAAWAARAGHRQVSITTIEHSPLSQAALKAGFLMRKEPLHIMLLPLSADSVPPPERWCFTPFMLSAW